MFVIIAKILVPNVEKRDSIIFSVLDLSISKTTTAMKILENTYRLVNISLINELTLLAGKMDINIWEVINAAKTNCNYT